MASFVLISVEKFKKYICSSSYDIPGIVKKNNWLTPTGSLSVLDAFFGPGLRGVFPLLKVSKSKTVIRIISSGELKGVWNTVYCSKTWGQILHHGIVSICTDIKLDFLKLELESVLRRIRENTRMKDQNGTHKHICGGQTVLKYIYPSRILLS